MARTPGNDFSGQTDSTDNSSTIINANGENTVQVPDNGFIADSQMTRDGQDLVLEIPSGETLTIQGYFDATPAPTIESPNGATLTGDLVNSFLHSPQQYASNSSMNDESPVGAVEEVSGDATVIRADGTSEPITLGTPIYQGDVIETSAEGAVNITFIDETSMAVSADARLSVDEYQFDPSTESGVTNFSVLRGVFMFTSGLIGRDDPDDVQIDTPVGSIGIRGTIIAGHINPGGESEITVIEGAIVIRNGAMERTLSQQFESIKLGGFNDHMHDLGVISAIHVRHSYGSVGHVVPRLFSSINDAAKEEMQAQKAEEQAAKEAAEEAAQAEAEAELAAEEAVEEAQPEPSNDHRLHSDFGNHHADHHGRGHRGHRSHRGRGRGRGHGNKHNYEDHRGFEHAAEEHYALGENAPRFHTSEVQVFENSKAGDLVARVWATNAPTGVTFSLSGGASDYTLTQDGNVVRVTLTNNMSVGSTISDFSIIATLPNGNTIPWDFAGNVLDAAVNTHTSGGLDYDVDTAAAITPNNDIGDINNDGVIDQLTSDPFDDTNGSNRGITTLNGIVNNYGSTNEDQYGHSVTGLGDFNGDGKSDYAVSAIGAGTGGKVYINDSTGLTSTITGQTGENLGEHISNLGDINGDGLSDLLISAGSNNGYVVFGSSTPVDFNTSSISSHGFSISLPGAGVIVGGGAAGDINGDGYDDFAISIDTGPDVDTYIVYGKGVAFTDIDMTYLENPDNALKIHDVGATGAAANDYTITALGDVDGDGFDDVQVGTSTNQYIVHGDLGGSNVLYVTDGAQNDAHGVGATTVSNDGATSDPNGYIKATAHGQSLVGGDNVLEFYDAGFNNLSMKGGGGNSNFVISDNTFRKIDGGTGNEDAIHFGSSGGALDFTNIDFEQIEQIEVLEFAQTGQTITLTAENIFNLLKSSDNGSLKIKESSGISGSTLNIDSATDYSNDTAGVLNALNESGAGAATYDAAGSAGTGFNHYIIGNYDLYIATGITTDVA